MIQTHLSFSLGHSFISPTSDFRKTKRKYEKKPFRATPAVCKNYLDSISIFTLSATLYLFLLQQYSLFHSLLYLNILFYLLYHLNIIFFTFLYYCFLPKITNCSNPSHPATTTTTVNQPEQPKTTTIFYFSAIKNHHKSQMKFLSNQKPPQMKFLSNQK